MLKLNYHPRPYYVLTVTYTGNDPHQAINADIWHGLLLYSVPTASASFIRACESLRIPVPPLTDFNNLTATSSDNLLTVQIIERQYNTSK